MREVAAAVGVSASTVSRALKNDPSISEATRERVRRAVERLGYRPDADFARMMSQYRRREQRRATACIGFIDLWPSDRGSGHPAEENEVYFAAAGERAGELGYRLERFRLAEDALSAERLEKVLSARNIRGLLFPPIPDDPDAVGRLRLDWSRYASAAIGYSLHHVRMSRSATHHYRDIWTALRRLTDAGYRRIGLALGPTHDKRVDHFWMAGFLAYQRFIPEACRVPLLLAAAAHLRFDEVESWFQRNRPDVVVSAQYCMEDWLSAMGFRVPGDVGVVQLAVKRGDLRHTGIRQSSDAIAVAAIDRVIAQLHLNEQGLPRHPQTTLVESDWAEGRTARGGTAKPGAAGLVDLAWI